MATKRRLEKTENDIRTFKLPVEDTKTAPDSLAIDIHKKYKSL